MKIDIRPVQQCTIKQIARQWDIVAKSRDDQIRSGLDISYDQVLSPVILQLAQVESSQRVLDVGCGSGVLSERIANHTQTVVGVDPSQQSIALAKASNLRPINTEYVSESIEDFSKRYQEELFDIAIANMVLQDASDLAAVLNSVGEVLQRGGTFVCTITHPCFWPTYWGYGECEWFEYNKEIAIDAPFRISSVEEPVGRTTHFHRPLSQYISTLRDTGFQIDSLVEPFPSQAIQCLYPEPWSIPRFLALLGYQK
jgi:2-polyprenyl-3-methyl-5-hydroxy-6-metoxy-1,4-benzoquinol methylase